MGFTVGRADLVASAERQYRQYLEPAMGQEPERKTPCRKVWS
jgi:hypothetical protein